MAKDQKPSAPKPGPVNGKGIRVGGGIITASVPRAPKPTKRGVRVGGGIITANIP